jgi:hypothetical protein
LKLSECGSVVAQAISIPRSPNTVRQLCSKSVSSDFLRSSLTSRGACR